MGLSMCLFCDISIWIFGGKMFLLVFLGFVLEGIIYEKSGKNMDLIETSKIPFKDMSNEIMKRKY